MEYNTTTVFHTRKNNYNSSPIDLATKIHQFCLEDKSVDLWLFSGEVLEIEDRKNFKVNLEKWYQVCPTQMEILLFLGKNSTFIKDPEAILEITRTEVDGWGFRLGKNEKSHIMDKIIKK